MSMSSETCFCSALKGLPLNVFRRSTQGRMRMWWPGSGSTWAKMGGYQTDMNRALREHVVKTEKAKAA